MTQVGRAEVKIVADARGFARDAERAINREVDRVNVNTGKIERDVDRNMGRAFIGAALNGLTQFGIILQGGISRQAAGAFGAALLFALLPIMAVVGAAAAGALILAFGSGIAAIGIIAAAQNKKVQTAFEDMVESVSETLQDIAKPFEPALIEIAELFEETFQSFAPALAASFEELAPAIVAFTEFLTEAFLALAPAIGPITDAFIILLEELGPALASEVFPDLADAIINLATAVGENADTITDIITWFLSAAEAGINFLATLTDLAGWFADNPAAIAAALAAMTVAFAVFWIAATGGIAFLVLAIIALGVLIFNFRDDIVNIWNAIVRIWRESVNQVSNFLGNLGRTIRAWVGNAIGNFQNLMSNVGSIFSSIGRFVTNLGGTVRDGFNAIVSFVGTIPGRIASAASGMWDSIVSTFKSAINGVIGAWNGLSFTIPSFEAFGKTVGGGTIGTPNIPFVQQGGIIEQAGAVRVGDGGPENLFLPQGAVVAPLGAIGGGAPDEFEATAVIDLGEGIQQVLNLTFKRVKSRATARSGRV